LRTTGHGYVTTKDISQKTVIIKQLSDWKEAAMQIPSLVKAAPNMAEFANYAARIMQAADIGLQMLEKSPDENYKAGFLQTLKSLKSRDDRLEILILPEIEALITGTLTLLPKSFSPF
jgi:hypothetical protein